MNKQSISKLFNKFAGREVAVIEKPWSRDIGGKTYSGISATVAPTDTTVKEMAKVAKENGLQLRLWLPDSMGTCDYREDRVNAHVVKEADGKYRVTKNFGLG